jgi:hypothetical protein
MTGFERVLIERDGKKPEQAKRELQIARSEVRAMLADGADYEDIEEMLMYDYGLEMDYIMDLL